MKFGKVILEKTQNPTIYADVIKELNLKPPVIIKPNWGTINNFTEAQVLDGVLSAIKGESLVVESYGWARTEKTLSGKGMGSKTKSDLRRSDEWFLRTSGIGEVLKKHSVEYLNVTEEVWAKNVADPEEIRKISEKYPPVQFKEMYANVPTRLYDLRGGTFLSLAKYRLNHEPIVVSLSLKNLFGLIPGPSRSKFHGPNDIKLDQSIVDINKIYHSLFKVSGMVDGVLTASIGRVAKDAINPEIAKNRGLLLGSEDCVRLDAFIAALEGKEPDKIGYLKLAASHFGGWSDNELEDARRSGIRIF
ncbi:MAG: DUF362 domain-containing protein [Candidatus Bathyarchaeota archaeon]|nr:DUF362 domain-containing protein [Candidatus Bathyarchaeota archaeon]